MGVVSSQSPSSLTTVYSLRSRACCRVTTWELNLPWLRIQPCWRKLACLAKRCDSLATMLFLQAMTSRVWLLTTSLHCQFSPVVRIQSHRLLRGVLMIFDAAIRQYEKEGVLGSKKKDIEVSRHFKVVGAEIDGSDKAVCRGVISVGAPAQKRVAMTTLSLRAAALPVITHHHQCGGGQTPLHKTFPGFCMGCCICLCYG